MKQKHTEYTQINTNKWIRSADTCVSSVDTHVSTQCPKGCVALYSAVWHPTNTCTVWMEPYGSNDRQNRHDRQL